ncbi:hypothetical protein ACJJTC_000384 [Scirpophaga incertulas]
MHNSLSQRNSLYSQTQHTHQIQEPSAQLSRKPGFIFFPRSISLIYLFIYFNHFININFTGLFIVDRPRWNHRATVMLIDLWKRQRTRFENNIERNEIIWEEIVSAMREAGFLFTAGQCETRFKYLKKCYIECIDINRKSTGQPERTCSYFEEMDELFHKSPQINPPRLVASRSLVNVPNTTGTIHMSLLLYFNLLNIF